MRLENLKTNVSTSSLQEKFQNYYFRPIKRKSSKSPEKLHAAIRL